MPVRLGPAGVPLSCKGRTIVEGIDDIIALGLDTMEVQTVRLVAPNHFDQFWQAGVLANKANFEMNIHGPYYAELLGNSSQRARSFAKMESALQAGKVLNARHITCHVGHYGETGRGREANEQIANIFAGVVDRANQLWGDGEEYPAFPWLEDGTPMKIGIETSGRQELWGSLEEVLEVVNHVEGTIPVINMAHIHARGHGRLKTSEDYGELFDLVRETIGTKTFYCHFSGIEHRSGNALHYTQIKKSDLNFDPIAEFLVEDGEWLDVTIISDSPLLEHDAMFMYQSIEKCRHRQLERKARDERQKNVVSHAGMEKSGAENDENADSDAEMSEQEKTELIAAEDAVVQAEKDGAVNEETEGGSESKGEAESEGGSESEGEAETEAEAESASSDEQAKEATKKTQKKPTKAKKAKASATTDSTTGTDDEDDLFNSENDDDDLF